MAVNEGLAVCFMPARKSRKPTAEKINHLPNNSKENIFSLLEMISVNTQIAGNINVSTETLMMYFLFTAKLLLYRRQIF